MSIGAPLTVNKGDDGVWTITNAPLAVGFHYYRVLIDGVNVADPATAVYAGGDRSNVGPTTSTKF